MNKKLNMISKDSQQNAWVHQKEPCQHYWALVRHIWSTVSSSAQRDMWMYWNVSSKGCKDDCNRNTWYRSGWDIRDWSAGGREASGKLIKVCKHFKKYEYFSNKDQKTRFLLLLSSKRITGNGQKLKYKTFQSNIRKKYFYSQVNQALEEVAQIGCESLCLKVLKPDWTQSCIHSALNRQIALNDLQMHLQPFCDFIQWAESWTNNPWLIPLPIKTAYHLCIFHCFKREIKILFLEPDASDLDSGGSRGWGVQGGFRNFQVCSFSLFCCLFYFQLNSLDSFK